MRERLDEIARSVIARGAAPAAAVAVAVRRGRTWVTHSAAAGERSRSCRELVTASSPFDLASVSKPFVAATVARLVQQGVLAFGSTLESLLEESAGTGSAATPLELLMAHRAGLKAYLPLYLPLLRRRAFSTRDALRRAAAELRPECRETIASRCFDPCYSDLGYLLLGQAASRAAQLPLDEIVRREVAQPLGLDVGSSRQWLRSNPDFMQVVVPTEVVSWRGGELVGVVHDENAWACAGHAICGHAGLFGTAEAVALFGAAVLDATQNESSWLSAEFVEPLLRPRPGGSLLAGFDACSPVASAAGNVCGARTFGHLGFTGTSFWCDPDAGCVTVLLTNRVNLSRTHATIRQARPEVHDRLFRLAIDAPGSSGSVSKA
jgi:CubicO group peptidase (beta-lactamase class C family)